MIEISCQDSFIKENFIKLLQQKNLILSNINNNKYFFKIKIVIKENSLELIIDKDKINFNLPKRFNEIFEKTYDILSSKVVYLEKLEYFPFKQSIIKKDKNIFLSEIQNNIMCNLLLNSEEGMKKIDLIQIIWPNDKDIFYNKLDTHLTNLKNYLKSELDYNLKFSSKSGLIKLGFN